MTLQLLLMFCLMETLMSLSPGPAVVLVASQGMRYGLRASIRGNLGILAGNLIYFACSAFGLGVVLLASAWLYGIIRSLGAAYLVWMGVKMLRTGAALGTAAPPSAAPPAGRRLFLQALITQLANPKAILYFAALLPQFIAPHSGMPVPLQCAIIAGLSVTIEFPILLLYGWLAARGRRAAGTTRMQAWCERIAGMILIGFGIKLALAKD